MFRKFRDMATGLGVAGAVLLPMAAWAQAEKPKLDSGDTAWVLTASALVLMMTLPGLALFYGGLVRAKNVLNVLMQCMLSAGIVGVLADAATQVGVPSVSCWAAVPHYAGHSPSPKATLALVSRLEDLLDGPIEHGELDEDLHAWERGINELAASDTEVAEYVESLEEAQDTADLPEASGDAIAKEFERYLRRRSTDEG